MVVLNFFLKFPVSVSSLCYFFLQWVVQQEYYAQFRSSQVEAKTFPTTDLDYDLLDEANGTFLNRSMRSVEINENFNITDDYFVFIDNQVDHFNVDLNDTDYDYYMVNQTIEATKDNILSDNGSPPPNEISKKILVAVPKQKTNKYLWIPLILLLGSAFFAHLGIRLIPWMLIGEVFPPTIRSTASGISGGMGYMFGFLANKLFLQMLAAMTMPGTFWFYSAVSFAGLIALYFVLPETEGRSLSDIQKDFATSKPKNKDPFEFSDGMICQRNISRNNDRVLYKPETSIGIDVKKNKVINPRIGQLRGAVNESFDSEEREENTTKL